jgi:ATP-binding cassette subfamily F protein 1
MRLELKRHSVFVGWRQFRIVENLNLSFDDDRCHCLVGINGVGKTALLLSLTRRNALLRPDGTWQPAMYVSARELIGAESMSVDALAGLFASRPHLDRWGLEQVARQPIQSLSQGEKTRLVLSVAETIEPQCLLLDEPTLGLDLESQTMLGDLIQRRLDSRLTTIVSTHDLSALDTEGCRIIYMHRAAGAARVVEGEDRILTGTADVAFAGREPARLQGSAAALARRLLEMQVERLR